MNIIKNIKIKNFRGFDQLTMEGLNRINLIIGKNNSGKSSILEAVFLVAGMSNPFLPDKINRFRGFGVKAPDDFKYLFHKVKFDNSPEINCIFSDFTERQLKLSPLYKRTTSNEKMKQTEDENDFSMDASIDSPLATGLELEFSLKKRGSQKKSFKSSILFNPPEVTHNINSKYKEDLHAVFISGDSKEGNALARYSEIVKRKKDDIVLQALKKIDPNIESIHPLPDGLFFSYKDIDELIPINISGDGVRRYLNIITTIAEKNHSLIAIDEIENGLHFSTHKLLWESIFNISREFNAQLFITTHNIETLKCLKDLIENKHDDDIKNSLSVINVSHTKKAGIKAYNYSFDGLKDAIETETEIR